MSDSRIIQPHHLYTQRPRPEREVSNQKAQGQAFKTTLNEALQHEAGLKLSKHAAKRLAERNIEISTTTWRQIAEKVGEAMSKGIQAPLVITKDTALVVSAKNKTVITAVSTNESQSQIFNGIDGAIFFN